MSLVCAMGARHSLSIPSEEWTSKSLRALLDKPGGTPPDTPHAVKPPRISTADAEFARLNALQSKAGGPSDASADGDAATDDGGRKLS